MRRRGAAVASGTAVPGRPPTRRRAVAVALVGLSFATVGCASPRIALGTTRSPCFQALPVAASAVGHQGQFAGVTRVTRSTLGLSGTLLPQRRRRPTTSTSTSTTLTTTPTGSASGPTTTARVRVPAQAQGACLVAFKGTFDRSKIPLLVSTPAVGRYAVVVVSVRTRQARAVYLIDQLPKSFSHL
jgi:hypothetical protein